jgi:hypothetical protein
VTGRSPLKLAAFVAASSLAHGALAAPGDATVAPPAAATEPAAPRTGVAPAPAPVPADHPATPVAPVAPAPATTAAPAPVVPPAADKATPSAPAAEEKELPSSLEIGLALAPSVVFGDAANEQYSPTLTRVGVFGELSIAYRSSYFLDPFISVGYASLANGEAHLPDGEWGAGGKLEQHLSTVTISPGITLDLWRFRPRFGMGIAIVTESYTFAGHTHSSKQTPLMAQFGLGFVALDTGRLRLDIEARGIAVTGSETSFATLGVVLRGDAVYFGAH